MIKVRLGLTSRALVMGLETLQFYLFLYLHCCSGFSLVAMCGLFTVVASLAAEHEL